MKRLAPVVRSTIDKHHPNTHTWSGFQCPLLKKKTKATKDYQTNKQTNSIEEKFSLKNHHKLMNIITMRQGQYAIKKGGGAFIIFLKELLEFKKDASRNFKKK